MKKEIFEGKVFILSDLSTEAEELARTLIQKHNGTVCSSPASDAESFDCVVYDPESSFNEDVLYAVKLIWEGRKILFLTVPEIKMLLDSGPGYLVIDGYTGKELHPGASLCSEPPVYYVEERDVTGKEADDWQCEWRYDHEKISPEGELWISSYRGDKRHVIVPASINGHKVSGICSNAFYFSKAETIEIPGTLKKCERLGISHHRIKALTIGEGIRYLDRQFFDDCINVMELRISQSVSDFERGCRYPGTGWPDKCMIKEGHLRLGSALVIDYSNESVMPVGISDLLIYYMKCIRTFYSRSRALRLLGVKSFQKDYRLEVFNNYTILINRKLYKLKVQDESGETLVIPDEAEVICTGALDYGFLRFGFSRNETKLHTKHIIFPDGLKIIESSAFLGVSGYTDLILPDGLTKLGAHCFPNNNDLVALTIPDSVTEIGEKAFTKNYSLREIVLPDTMELLDTNAFYGATDLERLVLPSFINHLGLQAVTKSDDNFGSHEKISYVGIKIPVIETGGVKYYRQPDGKLLDSYKALLFSNYTMFEDPSYPEDMLPVAHDVFEKLKVQEDAVRSSVIVRITPEEDYDTLAARGTGKFTNDVMLKRYPCPGHSSLLHFPSEITDIEPDPFHHNDYDTIKHIIMDNVKTIGNSAFSDCKSLETVRMNNAEVIGCHAFSYCTALMNVSMNNVRVIKESAFNGCCSLVIDKLPDTLEEIGMWALDDVKIANGIVIPKNVKQFGLEFCGREWLFSGKIIKIYRSQLYEFRNSFPETIHYEKARMNIIVLDDITGEVTSFIPVIADNNKQLTSVCNAFKPDNTFDLMVYKEDVFEGDVLTYVVRSIVEYNIPETIDLMIRGGIINSENIIEIIDSCIDIQSPECMSMLLNFRNSLENQGSEIEDL